MSLPNTIADGQNPSGDKLQENFVYLEGLITGGTAILTGKTKAEIDAIAAAAPTIAFSAIPTDLPAWILYTGDATAGESGFVTIVSWISGGIV